MTQERVDDINEWIKKVAEINSDTVSLSVDGDPFTKWDRESYTTVVYVNGEKKRDLTHRDTPSIRLHRINSIMKAWGLTLNSISGWNNGKFQWAGSGIYTHIEMNTFHTDLFKIGDSEWITFHERLIEDWIDEHIVEKSKQSGSKEIEREIKIRSIVKQC
jgi:hypothetical protein